MLAIVLTLCLAGPKLGPTLPEACGARMYAANVAVQALLAQSKFAEADKALAAWPSGNIAYELVEPLPDYAKGADEDAAKVWAEASAGAYRFAVGKNALVRIQLVENVEANDPLPEMRDGVVIAQVPKTFSYQKTPNTRRSVALAIAKAFGVAIGLEPTNFRSGVMGLDGHSPSQPPIIQLDDLDKRVLAGITAARSELASAVKSQTRLEPAAPKLEMKPEEQDAGNVSQGDHPEFKFVIRNKGNAPLTMVFEKSCGCVVLSNPDPIPPGGELVIEPSIMTEEMVGSVTKKIVMHTNDPVQPIREMQMHVSVYPEFRVLPDGFRRVTLPDTGPGEYELTAYAMPGKSLNKVSVLCEHKGVTASAVPFKNQGIFDPMIDKTGPQPRDGYRVTLKFADDFPAGVAWVRFTIVSDSVKNPKRDMAVNVMKGMTAQPPSAFFGNMKVGQPETRTVILEHPMDKFEILDAKAAGFDVKFERELGDGRRWKLIIGYTATKAGYFDGQVVVKTTQKNFPEVILPISGSATQP